MATAKKPTKRPSKTIETKTLPENLLGENGRKFTATYRKTSIKGVVTVDEYNRVLLYNDTAGNSGRTSPSDDYPYILEVEDGTRQNLEYCDISNFLLGEKMKIENIRLYSIFGHGISKGRKRLSFGCGALTASREEIEALLHFAAHPPKALATVINANKRVQTEIEAYESIIRELNQELKPVDKLSYAPPLVKKLYNRMKKASGKASQVLNLPPAIISRVLANFTENKKKG